MKSRRNSGTIPYRAGCYSSAVSAIVGSDDRRNEVTFMTCRTILRIAFLAVLLGLATTATSQDWPQWRGPNRDGAIVSFKEPDVWPEVLTQQWKRKVGLGYATPVLVDDRLYVFTRQGGGEVMRALNAHTGEIIWSTSYAAPFELNPYMKSHGMGPKSTPTYAGGRLFAFGMSGIVTAFDAETGKTIWQRPAPPKQPLYHSAMSPLVDGELVIIHVGGDDDGALTAFDIATGERRWSWDDDGPAYGSPVVVEMLGTRRVVTYSRRYMIGLSLESGELLWSRPDGREDNILTQTPILHGDLLIEAGNKNGFTAFRVVRQDDGFATEDVWHTDDDSTFMANGVAIDGVLFGLSQLNSGQYFGLDLDSGKVLWTSDPRQAKNAAIVRAGETIFSLEDDAELVVIRHSRTAFEPLERYKVSDEGETWAQPTISGNRLFIKDDSTLTLWTLN